MKTTPPAGILGHIEALRHEPGVRLVLVVTDDERGTIGAGYLRPDLSWRDVIAAQLALDRAQNRIEAQEQFLGTKIYGESHD